MAGKAVTIRDGADAIRAIDSLHVRAFHRDFYGTAVGEVAVVGDFDAGTLKQELRRLFADWISPMPCQRISSPRIPVRGTREVLETPDRAGAVLLTRLSFPLRTTDTQYPALIAANYILGGGVSSRLGSRIRQQEGLSYQIGSNLWGGDWDDDGGMQISASAAPGNIERLERARREELRRFVSAGITGQELADAKEGLLASYAGSRASDSAIAGTLQANLYLGRTMQWIEAFEASLRNLRVENVNAAIGARIDATALSVFIAGDFRRPRD
ncbi:MAG: insulinase family protein [Gammaproteobacteria bacterium]